MKIKRFEDIIAWQKGQEFAYKVYSEFKDVNDFGFKNQICRATVSISNNIAEGFDRDSALEFKRFLKISIASCSEVRSMLYLAEKLGYIKISQKGTLINDSEEISKIIKGLIKYLETYKPAPNL